jgi:hypothetical protein
LVVVIVVVVVVVFAGSARCWRTGAAGMATALVLLPERFLGADVIVASLVGVVAIPPNSIAPHCRWISCVYCRCVLSTICKVGNALSMLKAACCAFVHPTAPCPLPATTNQSSNTQSYLSVIVDVALDTAIVLCDPPRWRRLRPLQPYGTFHASLNSQQKGKRNTGRRN